MNQLINDVAIKLSQKIYTSIGDLVVKVNKGQAELSKNETFIPSFFQLRETIYDELVKYIKLYDVKYEHGKMDSRMPEEYKQRILKDLEEVEATRLGRDLLKSDVFNNYEYKTDYYSKVTKSFLIIDIPQIRKDADIGCEESLKIAFHYGRNNG